MISIDCYLQANSNRPQYLEETIQSINKQTIFRDKVIHIAGSKQLDSTIYDLLYKTDWKILSSHTYRVSTFKTVVQEVNSDYIFYTEDDIYLKQLPEWIPQVIEDYKPGLLSLNLGGSTCDYPKNLGDLINIQDRTILEKDGLTLFRRDYSLRSNYYFEFPCIFMNREMLNQMIPLIKGEDIEVSLTNAYGQLDVDKFYKASLSYTEFLTRMNGSHPIATFPYEMEKAKLYKLLDPHQGGVNWDLSLLQ